ncbi:MAG: sulfatase [Jatrophihabitans endophyticus]|nr:sulfatase [Jatrophihabitans endophyticus]
MAVLVLVAAVLAACTGGSSPERPPYPNGRYSTRPNIVFVLTDDLTTNLVRFMPHVIALEHAGMRFSNYTVTDSLCCPSRASIFTGRFPHNTKIFSNNPPNGGYSRFARRGENKQTFAIPLHRAGYRTGFIGKYLNGFQVPTNQTPRKNLQAHYIPPGWSSWDGAGYAYDEYGYDLDQNGTLHHYGTRPRDYLTTVMGHLGDHFIDRSARARKPFFLELSTFAPHKPAVPAKRDIGSFDLHVPRGPSYDRHPTDAPHWLRMLPKFPASAYRSLSEHYNLRVESVQAVDRMIGHVQATLRRTGQLKNTIFIFSSDNGYHLGQHGLLAGKLTAFDTDVRVPLVISGPGVPRNSVNSDVVQNVDLAPTFEQLAGAQTPATVDGRSFVPLLHGRHPPWRTYATIEHRGPVQAADDPDFQTLLHGNPPTYYAMRSPDFVYVRYPAGGHEYYDLRTDPNELHNVYSSLSPSRVSYLNTTLDRLIVCRGSAQCWAAADPAAG